MVVYIGADHRGFELKNKLIEYLEKKNFKIKDLGNDHHDPEDDFPVFASLVSKKVQKNPEQNKGIVICGSGVGVSIVANKFKGIRCVLGFDQKQVKSAVEHNQVNALALGADYIDFNQVKELVEAFLNTSTNPKEKYQKRINMISSFEN